MLNLSQEFLCGLALLVSAATASASAAPADGDLLRLVPGGVQIVSGISDPETSSATGRLLVVTENNNRDYDDCLALLGVDGERAINEVIEAAASSNTADLVIIFCSSQGASIAQESSKRRSKMDPRELNTTGSKFLL